MSSQAAGPVFHISSGSQCETLLAPRINPSRNASTGRQIHNTDEMLFSRLERFAMLLDRKLVGRRFNEPKNSHLRTKVMAVAEGNRSTGDLHCAIKVHPDRLAKFCSMHLPGKRDSFASLCWSKVSTGGTLVVKEIDDARGWGAYMVKSLFGEHRSDRVRFIN